MSCKRSSSSLTSKRAVAHSRREDGAIAPVLTMVMPGRLLLLLLLVMVMMVRRWRRPVPPMVVQRGVRRAVCMQLPAVPRAAAHATTSMTIMPMSMLMHLLLRRGQHPLHLSCCQVRSLLRLLIDCSC